MYIQIGGLSWLFRAHRRPPAPLVQRETTKEGEVDGPGGRSWEEGGKSASSGDHCPPVTRSLASSEVGGWRWWREGRGVWRGPIQQPWQGLAV